MNKLTEAKVLKVLNKCRTMFDISLAGLSDTSTKQVAEILTRELNAGLALAEAAENPTSFEARKKETLASVTANNPLPSYAKYANANGGIYIQCLGENGWYYKDIDFYEIIEAVAKRVCLRKPENT